MKSRRNFAFAVATCIALMLTIIVPGIHAGALNTDVIGLFPGSVGEFAYADLRIARQFPWFNQLKEQMLPAKFRQFEQFLVSAGMDPNIQVEELAWALVPTALSKSGPAGDSVPTADQILGVALGQYQPAAVQAYLKTQKTPSLSYRGFALFAFGGGNTSDGLYFMFLDPNTAAFGQRKLLENMLDIRFGQGQNLLQNNAMYSLINQANGHGIVWAVLNPAYTRLALEQLVPQTSQFPQAATLLATVRSLVISVQASSGIQASFQATCSTPIDATNMAAMIQAGIMFERYQAGKSNPGLASLLDSTQVSPSGDRLSISLALSNDQMVSLIQSKTFAVQN